MSTTPPEDDRELEDNEPRRKTEPVLAVGAAGDPKNPAAGAPGVHLPVDGDDRQGLKDRSDQDLTNPSAPESFPDFVDFTGATGPDGQQLPEQPGTHEAPPEPNKLPGLPPADQPGKPLPDLLADPNRAPQPGDPQIQPHQEN